MSARQHAISILGANVLLRRFAQLINNQGLRSATEIDQLYKVAIVCRTEDEIHVRTLILHMLNRMPQLMILSLNNEVLPSVGQLEVRAKLITSPNNHFHLEQIVSRISLEKGVIAARWAVLDTPLG